MTNAKKLHTISLIHNKEEIVETYYEQLAKLRCRGPRVVEEIVEEGRKCLEIDHPGLYESIVRILPYDQDDPVPIDRVAAVFIAAIDDMELQPAIGATELQQSELEFIRDGDTFLGVEEMLQRNRWSGLFERIQDAAAAQDLSSVDMEWLRKAVALVCRAARYTWRKDRRMLRGDRRRSCLIH